MTADEPMTMAELRALPATVDLVTAGRALGLGRTAAYALARNGEFPCRLLHLGRIYRVPTADLLRALGLDPTTVISDADSTATPTPPTTLESTSTAAAPPTRRRRIAGSRGLGPRRPR
jgi:hypothetical protein